jgi:hypothetical protein
MGSSYSRDERKISIASLTLAVMLKVPGAIEVKSRLAKSIGVEQALKAYRLIVETFLAQLPVESLREIYYTPVQAGREIKGWLGGHYTYYHQSEGDLGNRLAAACEESIGRGAEAAVLMGGDCPYIDQSVIEEAAEGLNKKDVVIGPTLDGGYYLIACKQSIPDLFKGIKWSTDSVFLDTLERIKTLGLSVFILNPLEDVDDLASWQRADIYINDEAGPE